MIGLEEVRHFGVVDYMLFGGMLCVSLLTGIYHGLISSSKDSAAHHLTARGELSTIPVALSLLASFLSSITLLGQPAEVYMFGPQLWLFGPACFLMVPIVGYIMIPFFRKNNYFSAYQYFGDRFNRKVQLTASLIFSAQMILYLALVLYAPALAVNQVTGLDTMWVVTLMYVVCIVYTTLGGMKAVVWTDTFQVLVLFGSLLAVVIIGTSAVGGVNVVLDKAAQGNRLNFLNWDLSLTERFTVWSSFLGSSLLHITAYGGNQLQVQRYLSVKSTPEARKMLWINAVGWSMVVGMTTYVGLLIFATYAGCDPLTTKKIQRADQIFPLFVMDTLMNYPGLPGVFMCGIFSAGLSTVSTGMNSLAAIWYAEINGTLIKEELVDKSAARLVKLLAMGFGIISYLLVFLVPYLGGLLQVGVSFSSICAGSLFSLFLLGIYFPFVNSWGAVSGLLSGLAVMSWITLGNIVAGSSGQIVSKPLPLSAENCTFTYNATVPQFNPLLPERTEAFWLYRIAFFWYSGITIIITIGVAIIVSLMIPTRAKNMMSPPERVSAPLASESLLRGKKHNRSLN